MSTLLKLLLPGSGFASTSASGSQHLTDAPDIPRQRIGPAAIHLEPELQRFYWDGVKRELPHIILTLQRWQSREQYSDTVLPDEEDGMVHGFDTFLDQVSHSSRQFSQRNSQRDAEKAKSKPKTKNKKTKSPPGGGLPSYNEALENRGWDFFAEMKSTKIKGAIRESLANLPPIDVQRRRARMLLQSAQFLDIDKVIEYRDPEKILTFWKRPAVPQLKASDTDDLHMPVLVPQICTECHKPIRGSLFRDVKDDSVAVCEKCYRDNHYKQSSFTKQYKTCCLAETVTPEVSRKICHCPSVQRRDRNGRLKSLWPLEGTLSGTEHLKGRRGAITCGLHELTDTVAEAKYAATRLKSEKDNTLEHERRKGVLEAQLWNLQHAREVEAISHRPGKLKNINTEAVSEFGTSYGHTTSTPEDIPIYLRSVTDKYPYGNVHMALRLGPMIIENGVENTHGGVVITSRDPPNLQVLRDSPPDIERSLLLTGKADRTLYSQSRPRAPKRYKAMMKQVVGGAFCSFFAQAQEDDVIDTLIRESQGLIEDAGTAAEKAEMLDAAGERLLLKLKQYLSSRVHVYIASIASRLLDPDLDIRWTFHSNNCQTFCDHLLDRKMFGSFFASPTTREDQAGPESSPLDAPAPLYLMSFVCRPGSYVPEKAKSKFDVPNGLTEEYLLKFRYGRHEESDIIDSLAEYWYDWGGFERPIYQYQDIFPWDCTEAYGRYPVRCGDCNISKHVWAFPFDSWSILSLHLSRGRHLYPRNSSPSKATNGYSSGHMPDHDWFLNRLTVLLGQDMLLTAAVAMAQCGSFRESTYWLHMQADETQDRLKLGGIHRAQPFSHHFEKGAYHLYFVAEWASLERSQRIAAYEALRDWRAVLTDVGSNKTDNDDSGGCGGCGGFVCGAMMGSGCAGGCSSNGGDTCGSGCVSSCSSCGGGCGGGCGGCG